jgi:hypothetical protein
MKKLAFVVGIIMMLSGLGKAQIIVLEGVDTPTLTTGDLIDEADHLGRTTNVVEIPGLEITIRSGASNQDVNALADSLGIDSDGSEDISDAFEAGERLIASFNKKIEITQFDFNRFSSGEVFSITVAGEPGIISIEYDDLTQKSSGYFDTNLMVEADTEMEFYTTGSSVVGLDRIDVTVQAGSVEPALSFFSSNGTSHIAITFDGQAETNYLLQSCTNLASNDWSSLSGFSSDTNWMVETTNAAGFFRAIAD